MHCPFCGFTESKVVDSRATEEGSSIRRRRECLYCEKRFTTYEIVEQQSLIVIKKDGRRETFNRVKILNGLLRAFEKRPIPLQVIEAMVDKVEKQIRNTMEREISTQVVGEIVMEHLKDIDQVAYVRFASVYRQFADINNFVQELNLLTKLREMNDNQAVKQLNNEGEE